MDDETLVWQWIIEQLDEARHVYIHLNWVSVALAVSGAYSLYIVFYGLFLCPTRHIPGPFFTRFTNLYPFYLTFSGDGLERVRRLHQKYGPVLRLAPRQLEITLPEMALVGWAGQNEMKKPWDRDPELAEMARNGLPVNNIMSEPDYAKAARFRRLMGPPFARKFLFDLDEPVKMCTKRMIEKIEELRTSQDGIVELMNEFTHYSFDALTDYAYGGYFKGAEAGHGVSDIDIIKQATLSNIVAGLFPTFYKVIQRIPLKALDWLRARDEFRQISERSINAYKENVKLGSRKDSLGALIAARDEDGVGLSHQDLVGAGCVLLVAGVDTTAIALCFIAYLLTKYPEYFDKLATEVKSYYDDTDQFRSIELEKMPLLNAVIRESLRLYPPAGGRLGRISPPGGAIIGGYHIPENVIVYRPAWSICRDSEIYKDPQEFKPERWLGLSREEERVLWDRSMIFGYGPRVCLGKELALMELRMLLAALVMNYTWTGAPLKPGKWDEEMRPYETLIIRPWNGRCRVKLEVRL